MSNLKEATKCYDRSISLNPKQARFWISKGLFLDKIGRHADAQECYKIALELDPNAEISIEFSVDF